MIANYNYGPKLDYFADFTNQFRPFSDEKIAF